jgi:hypothetical protein
MQALTRSSSRLLPALAALAVLLATGEGSAALIDGDSVDCASVGTSGTTALTSCSPASANIVLGGGPELEFLVGASTLFTIDLEATAIRLTFPAMVNFGVASGIDVLQLSSLDSDTGPIADAAIVPITAWTSGTLPSNSNLSFSGDSITLDLVGTQSFQFAGSGHAPALRGWRPGRPHSAQGLRAALRPALSRA